MRTVWKFILRPGTYEVPMPCGAKLLTAQLQGDAPCLWAEVDDEQPLETRTFISIGTGHEIPLDARIAYVATFQFGQLVFHLHEVLR